MENMPISLIALLLVIGLFVLGRELLCWYWKINKGIKNQERIIELLEIIVKQGQATLKNEFEKK